MCLLKEEVQEVTDPVNALLEGKVQTVEFSNGSVVIDAPRPGRVYMAGSFNPLHDGHRGMLAAALKARQDKQGQPSLPLAFKIQIPFACAGCTKLLQAIVQAGLLLLLCLHFHLHKRQMR